MVGSIRRQSGALALLLCVMPGQWVTDAAAQSTSDPPSEIARFPRTSGAGAAVPAVGTRVRVTAPGVFSRSMIGDVLTVDEQTLTITNERNEQVSIGRELVTRLEVSMGQKRHLVAGLLIGAVVGVALGSVGSKCGGFFSSSTPCYTRGELVRNGGLVFGAFGAIGGWLSKSDKWIEVPLDQVSVDFGLAPSGHGTGVLLTVAF